MSRSAAGETKTAEFPGVRPAQAKSPSYRLVVRAGPDAGASVQLEPTRPLRLLVGSSSACDLVLRDPLISRRHASFDVSGSGVRLTDLGSKNGCVANGVQVFDAVLRAGDEVALGETTLRLELSSDGEDAREASLSGASNFGRLVGASTAMRRLYPLCARLASSDLPVIIEGETGTGKELLSECLHELGPRKDGPFVVFDCAGTPPALVATTLFGVDGEPGSGAFAQAHGGTLLLDEVAELDVDTQALLLRAVERGEIRPVGAPDWRVCDVRVLAALRHDPERDVQRERFREDLFYRLSVGRVELPPLRSREGDAGVLAEYFWRRLGGGNRPLPRDFLLRYEGYPWPGNVRELRNAVARLASFGVIDVPSPPSSGSDAIERALEGNLLFAQGRDLVVREYERRFVEKALTKHNGNVSRAAAASGLARRYFHLIRSRSTAGAGPEKAPQAKK